MSRILGPDSRDEAIAEWRQQNAAIVRWLVLWRDGVEIARYPHDGSPPPPAWNVARATEDPLVHECVVAHLVRVEGAEAHYDA